MDVVTGAVVIVGLQQTAKPTVELVKDFLSRLLAPTGDAVGKALAHPVEEWQRRRVERASELVAAAAALVVGTGAEAQPVPGRVLWPILQNGSLEEEPELQDRWAALLASASTHCDDILPAYAYILDQLTVLHVHVLDWMYRYGRISSVDDSQNPGWRDIQMSEIIGRFGLHIDTYSVLASDLHRLQVIDGRRHIYTKTMASQSYYALVNLTPLGVAFVRSCQSHGSGQVPRTPAKNT